ncbi:hypothetical protein [Hydrogenophaga sp.]|uniref:hypothetical protein n=1 Tax=Hydrogenophaga sp. TaxID=1904254 RepID=UPI00261E9D0F|nr:hypothetical protein [Hydrogenophaga sp.]
MLLGFEFDTELMHAAGFFPKGDVCTQLVFYKVGSDHLGISGPLLDDDAQLCKALITFGKQFFGNLQARVSSAVGRVLVIHAAARDGEDVGDAVGLDAGLELVISRVDPLPRVMAIGHDFRDRKDGKRQLGVAARI